jgi:hypothetical protein
VQVEQHPQAVGSAPGRLGEAQRTRLKEQP